MRVGLASIITVLLTVATAAAQQNSAPNKLEALMTKTELKSFLRTLATEVPQWKATISATTDPLDLNLSYGMGKLLEAPRVDFLEECEHLDRELPRILSTPTIRAQIWLGGMLEDMKGELREVIILSTLSNASDRARRQDEIGQIAKELTAADARLTSHLFALSDKVDSVVEIEKLLP